MNVEERKLISGLFDRMQGMKGIEKDAEAAALIEREAAANSDAVYLLTQSVLVQEQALQKANARIQELEAAEETSGSPNSATSASPRKSAGFGQPSTTSVPTTGGASQSSGFTPSAARPGASSSEGNRGLGGGGFMGQAMTTAAGVAGGMLLANGISSLFSGSSSSANAAETSTAEATPASDQTADNSEQAAAEDANVENASADADDGGWFGGDDWGDFGGDLEL